MTPIGAPYLPQGDSQIVGSRSSNCFSQKAETAPLSHTQTNTRFQKLVGWMLLLVCIFSGVQQVNAREVPLREVPITLYSKSVTGYRLLMDRPLNVVTDQITDHVGAFTSLRPFQYERTIIYENLRYAPVSRDREISLYYILRELGSQLSEVTLVVMYDYRRSVNSHEFPDLSSKIQVDLAQLLRKTTGDLLKAGNRLIDDSVLEKAVEPEQPVVEHFREEEVENEGVLLRDDPFRPRNESDANPVASSASTNESPSGTPDLQQLKNRILELESRERSLLAETRRLQAEQSTLVRKQEQLMDKLTVTRTLQDSVQTLNSRVEEMLGHYYLSDDFSVSSDAAAEMQDLERRIKLMDERYDRLKFEKDSLALAHQEVISALGSVGSGTRRRVEEKRILEKEKTRLEKENAQLRAQIEGADSPVQSIDGDSLADLLAEEKQKQAALFRKYSDLQIANQTNETELARQSALRSGLALEVEQLNLDKQTLQADLDAALKGESPDNAVKISSDSLKLFKVRLQGYQAMETRFNQQQLDLSQQEQSLQQNAQTIRNLNNKIQLAAADLKRSQELNAQLQGDLQGSQQKSERMREELEGLREGKSLSAQEQRRLNSKVDALQKTLKASSQKTEALEDSVLAMSNRQQQLNRTVRQRNEQLRSLNSKNDSVQGILSRTRDANLKLSAEIADLEFANDSLRKAKANPADQQAFIREQFSRLEDWEGKLKTREAEATNQKKLIDQKERFLNEKEKNLGEQENRLADLEEREKQVRLKEQQLGTGAPVKFSIREGRVLEFGEQVPVFIVDTDVSSRSAQRRVCAFMLQRDELVDEQFPDIVFQMVQFPELSTQPVTVRVRIDANGSGSTLQISFQEADNAYIGASSDRTQVEAARQVAGQMIRYKF